VTPQSIPAGVTDAPTGIGADAQGVAIGAVGGVAAAEAAALSAASGASVAPAEMAPAASAAKAPRRGYVDWLRGLAVVIMIEAHTIDSWTAPSWRVIDAYWWGQLIAGMSAPLFLFLAGVSVPMAAGSRMRRGASHIDASLTLQKRGWQILLLALLFRVQSFVVSPGSTLYGILKVDILNVMGPAIAGAALVWGLAGRRRVSQVVCLAAVAIGIALMTPPVRTADWLAPLPDVLEAYLRSPAGRSTFTFFPWSGFVFAGAALGVLLDASRTAQDERRLNAWFAAAGLTIAAAAYAGSFLPTPFKASSFWTSSPSFYFIRIGLLVASVAVAYAWGQRATAARFSPLQQFGRTSLFVYWIHVELVYGFISTPLHKNLSLPQWFIAYALFTWLMFRASMWWTNRAKNVKPRAAAKENVAPPLTPAPSA
jgi:uncharacterized membrane protein